MGRKQRWWGLVPPLRDTRPVADGPGWSVHIRAPEHAETLERDRGGAWEEANRLSAVLQVLMSGRAVWIGGDAPLRTWSELPPNELKADFFRLPHHGGALDDGGVPPGWTVDRLYDEVQPHAAIISVGTRNPHGHPNPEWIAPVMHDRCRLLCTQATERCQPGLKNDATTFRDAVMSDYSDHLAEPPWRHYKDVLNRTGAGRTPEVSCAGTVVVHLPRAQNVEPRVLPTRAAHQRIIDVWKTPLCRPQPDGSDATSEPTS